MKLFNRVVRPLCLCKAGKIADHCERFIGGKVLDMGAGRCYIARELQQRCNADVTCIDVADLNETDMNLTVYDGKKLPYKSNAFDTALLVYVLHHCEDPLATLEECKRVIKGDGKIIIFEDFGFILFNYVLDWISNKLHNVRAPLNFKSREGWMDAFGTLGLELVSMESGVERQWFYPFVEHTMFVLRVKK